VAWSKKDGYIALLLYCYLYERLFHFPERTRLTGTERSIFKRKTDAQEKRIQFQIEKIIQKHKQNDPIPIPTAGAARKNIGSL